MLSGTIAYISKKVRPKGAIGGSMKKKRLLIINQSFGVGGIQSSMVNMANELSNDYEVDLFVYNPSGVMKERLSDNVKVLESSWRFKCLGMSISETLKTNDLKMISFRLFAAVWTKLFTNEVPINLAIKYQPHLGNYDLVISYRQEQGKRTATSGFARVADRCASAKQKVAWLHFDSDAIDLDSQYNKQFYQKMDKIVCVSKTLMENFSKKHTEFQEKMEYCYNFMPYDTIKEKSLLVQEVAYPANKFVCFSACRLSEEKALVRAIGAFADILKEHKDIVWYIAGEGAERANIEMAIKEHALEEHIALIGTQNNPYPYMRNANLVLNVSYHEAAPMVFFESRALGTPMFATRTASADELLRDQEDAFICDNSEEGIRDAFALLMANRELVQNAKKVLANYHISNDESLLKIKKLLGEKYEYYQ